MTKRKLALLSLSGIAALALAVCLFLLLAPKKDVYNKNPDLSGKVSTLSTADRLLPVTTNDLVNNSELIMIGTVQDDGVASQYNIVGSQEIAEKMAEKGLNAWMPCTLTKISVDRVVTGKKPSGDTITLFQLGEPGGQAQVKSGDKVLLILTQDDETPGTYVAKDLENSVFYIDKNNQVRSMSDQMACAKYDDRPLSLLEKDILATEYIKSKK